MAKGRFISKEISLDEKVDALSSDTARLLFTWMIPHLDCEGRMYGDAQVFKSLVAPRRNYSVQKVEKILTELEKLGLVARYFVGKNQYLFAPNFEKHQVGLQKNREAQSRIPPPNTRVNPELIQNNSGKGLIEVEVKDKVKDKEEVEEERAASPEIEKLDFDDYIEELRREFSDLNFDNELKKFHLYWSEGGRKLKRPKLALRNWMEKARKIKAQKVKGNDPDKYVKQKYGHLVARTKEDIERIKELRESK